MRIITVLGSPHLEGNTERLLDWAERAWTEWGHHVQRINLVEKTVHGCKACLACAESSDAPGCILSDDGPKLFSQMTEADGIVYATPLYMWGFASQLKALLDRSICLVRGHGGPDHRSFVQGKPTALLVSCAGPAEGNADLIEESFRRFAAYARLDDRGVTVFPHCTDVNMLPNTHGSDARALARRLVQPR